MMLSWLDTVFKRRLPRKTSRQLVLRAKSGVGLANGDMALRRKAQCVYVDAVRKVSNRVLIADQ